MKIKDTTLKVLTWIALVWTVLGALETINHPAQEFWIYSIVYLVILLWIQIRTLRRLL